MGTEQKPTNQLLIILINGKPQLGEWKLISSSDIIFSLNNNVQKSNNFDWDYR